MVVRGGAGRGTGGGGKRSSSRIVFGQDFHPPLPLPTTAAHPPN